MIELNTVGQIIRQHFPLTPNYFRRKRWKIAQARNNHRMQVMLNNTTEAAYMRIIEAVKKQFIKPGEIYFERNYRDDEVENFLTMHCLMTSTCYLYLECDFCYNFQVEFAFDNCPYESAIWEMFKNHPLDTRANQRTLDPDFQTFFTTVLKVQDKEFIKTFHTT